MARELRGRRGVAVRPVRHRVRAALLLLLALLAPVLSGCSLVMQEPEVRVARVGLAELGLRGGAVEVLLEVANPNGFALETRAFRYALAVPDVTLDGDTAWVPLVDEESRDTVRVEARDTVSLPVRIPFDLATVGAAAGRLLRDGELGYRFTGALRLQTPLGGVDVPFERRGTFRP